MQSELLWVEVTKLWIKTVFPNVHDKEIGGWFTLLGLSPVADITTYSINISSGSVDQLIVINAREREREGGSKISLSPRN